MSFISIMFFISFRVQDPSNLSFLSFQLCFSFLSGCRTLQIFHFFHFNHFFKGVGPFKSFISFISIISLRVRDPSNLSFLSFQLCFSFLSGCRTPQIFHFFISIISFRVQDPSNLSFLSFQSFLSGCRIPQIFHFFHFNHFFQGAGSLKSFISIISIISFRVWDPSNLLFLSFQLCFSFLSGCGIPHIFHFFHFNFSLLSRCRYNINLEASII